MLFCLPAAELQMAVLLSRGTFIRRDFCNVYSFTLRHENINGTFCALALELDKLGLQKSFSIDD